MEIFFALLLKIIPLYIIIFLGFIAGKILHVKKESIVPLLIYIIVPIIVFNGVVTTPLTTSTLSLPILFFTIATCLCLVFSHFGRMKWSDSTKNILAYTAGNGNTGYFGLPVAIALFGNNVLGLVVLCTLGLILYDSTVGFFTVAKGHHTVGESVKKVLMLPSLYAFILGIIIHFSGIHLGNIYADAIVNFKGAYTILGMMIIGLGLSDIEYLAFDFTFIGISFFAKFLLWPSIILAVIFLDSFTLKLYTSEMHKVMILLSIVPLAANTVAYATQLKAQPEKASVAVLLSTLFALFYIPIVTISFLK